MAHGRCGKRDGFEGPVSTGSGTGFGALGNVECENRSRFRKYSFVDTLASLWGPKSNRVRRRAVGLSPERECGSAPLEPDTQMFRHAISANLIAEMRKARAQFRSIRLSAVAARYTTAAPIRHVAPIPVSGTR